MNRVFAFIHRFDGKVSSMTRSAANQGIDLLRVLSTKDGSAFLGSVLLGKLV